MPTDFGNEFPAYGDFPSGYGGGGYDPYGGYNFGDGGGGGGGGSLAWLAPLIGAGSQLIGGYLGNRAQGRSEDQNREATRERIALALSLLSPDAINALYTQFLPQIMARTSAQTQTSVQGLKQSQARRGIFESPIGLTQEAGLRGQMALGSQQAAFSQAMDLARQQASAVAGVPIPMTQPNYNYAQGVQNAFNVGFNAYSLAKNPQGGQQSNYQTPDPYRTFYTSQAGESFQPPAVTQNSDRYPMINRNTAPTYGGGQPQSIRPTFGNQPSFNPPQFGPMFGGAQYPSGNQGPNFPGFPGAQGPYYDPLLMKKRGAWFYTLPAAP